MLTEGPAWTCICSATETMACRKHARQMGSLGLSLLALLVFADTVAVSLGE